MNNKIKYLRKQLGLVFDDNLGTDKWYNIVDWVIIFMILLSSVEIFISTLPIAAPFENILNWINSFTLWFFVVEVSLRIWAAPEQSPHYRGWRGRLRYCFTFYGFIDFISTYPFLIQFFVPIPLRWISVMRTARVIRIFRITRYAKSFNLLTRSIAEKRKELIVSMQFLVIITFILSLILYFHEHEAQPDVYDNGFVSVLWAFAQYIGDPGQFADTPPVTVVGRVIACIVGLLGIAIVAVPAGILGAGFTETIEAETKKNVIRENAARLRSAFQRKLDRPSGIQIVPPNVPVATLQVKLSMTENEIIESVNSEEAPHFRLVNLASSIPVGKSAVDRMAVEHFLVNRTYGQCIDRGSLITIIDTSSYIDTGIGNWSYYLSLIGGFNYVSREIGDRAASQSYFNHGEPADTPGLTEFISDIRHLLSRSGSWGVITLVSSGALEPEYPTNVHLQIGGRKGDTAMGGEGLFVKDVESYTHFYEDMCATLGEEFGLTVDHQKYHDTSGARNILRRNDFPNGNNIIMRIEWHKILWDPRRMLLARSIAEMLARDLAGEQLSQPDVLKVKDVGFDGYDA